MLDLQTCWRNILDILQNEMPTISYKTFIRDGLKPIELTETQLMLEASDSFTEEIVSARYCKMIGVTASEILEKNIEIKLTTPQKRVKKGKINDEVNKVSNLNPKYIFENFVVGESNRMAHAASVAVAESPGNKYNPLFLYGNSGLGKTHLMQAIAHYILDQNPDSKVLYASCEQFTNELITAIREGKTDIFRDKYRKIDVLLIDDIQFITDKEKTQEEFFHTFNDLTNLEKQIIISSDRHPDEIKTLADRLRSRFSCGLIADIKQPDFETRTAIIEKKAQSLNIAIPKEVSQFIAQTVKNNIRVLEGALNKVIAYNQLKNASLTVELAKKALEEEIANSESEPMLSVDTIKAIVSQYYDIKLEDIDGPRRTKSVADARQIAMYFSRELLNETLKSIGQKFERDHTTVIHAIEKVEKLYNENPAFKKQLDEIEIRLKRP